MKRFLLIFLILLPLFSKGTHIVGGEFELIHIDGNRYRLNLILYFDLFNGDPGARDQSVTARIFRSRDNAVMLNVFLPLTTESAVSYTAPECSIGQLNTSKLTYTTEIILSDENFSDSLGYYVAWERCCRNYTIDNILSNAPQVGQYAGQTFYLEIPPVTKEGQPFINSTPRLFPPLSDYACQGKPYYVDFAGTDDDGDSLVYSLVEPLNTKSGDALPLPNPPGLPRPRPYPNVTWAAGFSLNNIMQGAPDLAISTEGILTVTPTQVGLFVFAVKCEEFRDGVKIGETRRDFQMLTVSCPTATAPVVKGRKLGETDFSYINDMAVSFPAGISNADRCIEVQITDQEALTQGSEFVKIKQIISLDKKTSKNEVILPNVVSATLTAANNTVIFKICFKECPLESGVPYKIGVIVQDDACALPLLDTLRVSVTVDPPPNARARFVAPATHTLATLDEGDYQEWPIEAIDDDGDLITMAFLTDGFNPPTVGMDLDFNQTNTNHIEDTLVWDAKCDKYDFSTKQTFKITLLVDDADKCSYNKADTVVFDLILRPPPNGIPEIDTDITASTAERIVDGGKHEIYQTVTFQVSGKDTDPYPISLEATGIGFTLPPVATGFQPPPEGLFNISSTFTWPLNCELFDLAEKDSFAIRFVVIDKNNWCKIYQADTVDVGLKILQPNNFKPALTTQNLQPLSGDEPNIATRFLGSTIEFLLTGTDQDEAPVDNISIEMIDVTGNVMPEGYTFTPVTGKKHIETKFIWQPDCSIFANDIFENNYEFKFRVFDDHCESALADTVTLQVNMKDYAHTDENFLPPNAITPNGDNVNDYFALDGFDLRDDGSDPDSEIALPFDNCLNRFESISIYNRWGKLVFTSTNRFFRWYAPNAGAGVYYYLLKFTNKDYKSSVMVRY